MKRDYLLLSVFLILGAIAGYFYLHVAPIPVLQPAGPIALAERHVIIITLLLSSIIVIPVFFLLFFFAWKYRAHSPEGHVHHRPNWDHDNPAAEFIWWLVPSAIIAVLSVIAWQSSHALDPYEPIRGAGEPITIQVVALNWKWLFIYPQQHIASLNVLEIPENIPVRFVLTADAPMNSFWIPSLGGQIMVMPGMTTQLNLMASRVGVFNGSSGNMSGEGFSGMTFKVRSLSRSDFDKWVAAVQNASSSALNSTEYEMLVNPTKNDPPAFFSSVDPNLYTSIHMKYTRPTRAPMNADHTAI